MLSYSQLYHRCFLSVSAPSSRSLRTSRDQSVLFSRLSWGPRPRDRFYYATAPRIYIYYRKRIPEAIHARKVVVSGRRAYSVHHPPFFPCFVRVSCSPSAAISEDYVRPRSRLATFVKMSFRATPPRPRTSFELPCQA